jgi:hypothetical protein
MVVNNIDNGWGKWVVLIAGSTGSVLLALRPSPISHRHYAGVALTALSHSKQTDAAAGSFQHSICILNPYEEKLISKPKRQVLQKRRIKYLEPALQRALCLRLDVPASCLPAAGELFRNLMHFNLVHGFAYHRDPKSLNETSLERPISRPPSGRWRAPRLLLPPGRLRLRIS